LSGAANPAQPRGYRLTRRFLDRSVELAAALALSIPEYERIR
jgi:hypothetical protein